MAEALRRGVSRLETTTKLTLAILALASGVYTYLGVRGLLQGIGPVVFFGAIVYSTAVSIGIYAFWSYLIQFTPHIKHAGERRTMIAAMILGSMMIVAMSSWLNAAALAGGAALEQHLANTTEDYQSRLSEAHNNALAAQGLLPDIQLATDRFRRLAQEEQATGSLTGTSGSGTVVQLLLQMGGQLEGLAEEVRAARVESDALFVQGGRHLGEMRRFVTAAGPIEPRSIAFAEEAVSLAGVIAALSETSIAPAVKRAAEDLSTAFVAPEVDGQTGDLAARQQAIVARVETAIAAQSNALAAAADDILARDPVRPLRFTPLSTPEAVLLYAQDFLPSWAGAISIDLMPAVLILILAGVHSAIRREEGAELDAHHVTVAEMTQALRLYSAMQEAQAGAQQHPAAPEKTPDAPPEQEQEVAQTDDVSDARNQPGVTPSANTVADCEALMVYTDQSVEPEETKRRLSDVVLGLVFAVMIAGSGIALYYDFRSLSLSGDSLPGFLRPGVDSAPMRAPRTDDQVRRYDPRVAPERGPLDVVELPGFDGSPDDAIGRPMEYFLGLDGRASAVGRIGIGAFDGFARFLDENPGVTTVTFHSPGGSVRDAMAMAQRLRDDELATHVAAFGYCASSCPLAFSGGVERTVTGEVWFGVHQVFTSDAQVGTLQDGMAGAQHISSQAQQMLDDMGVDPRAWIHAMATPKEELYLFTEDELTEYSWVTQ